MDALFADSGQVEGTLTVISVVILVLATLSFSRAMQRMYQQAYGRQPAVSRTLHSGSSG